MIVVLCLRAHIPTKFRSSSEGLLTQKAHFFAVENWNLKLNKDRISNEKSRGGIGNGIFFFSTEYNNTSTRIMRNINSRPKLQLHLILLLLPFAWPMRLNLIEPVFPLPISIKSHFINFQFALICLMTDVGLDD
jgi:hypothetical protein